MLTQSSTEENTIEPPPRREVLTDKLDAIVISFEKNPKNPNREERKNIIDLIRSNNPKTLIYLEKSKIEYTPLGSTGSLVANMSMEKSYELKNDEVNGVIQAPNSYKVYKKVLNHKKL